MTIQDQLHRRPLARNIYNFISRSTSEEALRVGIYGKWGEGKTTILRFIEEYAKEDKHEVVWVNPWNAQDLVELFTNLYFQLEPKKDENTTLSKWEKFKNLSKEKGIKLFPYLKQCMRETDGFKLVSSLALLPLKNLLRHIFEKQIKDNKKVIFIIDDLDRTKPALVPQFLLSILEDFNIKGCVFVFAFDPHIIARSLPVTHPGWGTTLEFLEKIIDFPFWMPNPRREDILHLAYDEARNCPFTIDPNVLKELIVLFPENPRKLKLYFKALWKLKGPIERHSEDEIDWILLLLIELMRSISFNTTQNLLLDEEFWKKLLMDLFLDGLGTKNNLDDTGKDTVRSFLEERIKNQELDDTQKEHLIRILLAVKTMGPLKTYQNVRYWSRISDDPDVFTWKEIKDLFEEYKTSPSLDRLNSLITSHVEKREVPVHVVEAALFNILIDFRQEILVKGADAQTYEELSRYMAEAEILLKILWHHVVDLQGFTKDPQTLTLEDHKKLFAHIGKWIRWETDPLYNAAHVEEVGLIKVATENCLEFAEEILDHLKIWDPLRFGDNEQLTSLRKMLYEICYPVVLEKLRQRFRSKNGIGMLFPEDKHLVEKYFLFTRDAGFYDGETLDYLLKLSGIAKADANVHENFIEILRLIDYSLLRGNPIASQDDMKLLASDKEIMKIFWDGAIAARPNPRANSSLMDARQHLVDLVGEEYLVVPIWASDKLAIQLDESSEHSPSDVSP